MRLNGARGMCANYAATEPARSGQHYSSQRCADGLLSDAHGCRQQSLAAQAIFKTTLAVFRPTPVKLQGWPDHWAPAIMPLDQNLAGLNNILRLWGQANVSNKWQQALDAKVEFLRRAGNWIQLISRLIHRFISRLRR